MRRYISFALATVLLAVGCSSRNTHTETEHRIDNLLGRMTLEEKIGQMNQSSGLDFNTGPWNRETSVADAVEHGLCGSVLNVYDAGRMRELQTAALHSRLGIPLLFGLDVVHGLNTIFPIPLAEAASFDLGAIERSAFCAGREMALSGVNWTFAPMVDIARDPRWGRVMEGAGEDTFWGSQVAAARVRGFQRTGVMACVKHFAGYGASIGGRDYNNVDMSSTEFYNTCLPPFRAAVEAGAATVMTAFNDLDGIPCTGNKRLLNDILRCNMGFDGMVVSDWCSVAEMCKHRYAADEKDAALKAIEAGLDMDMVSRCYAQYLPELVAEGSVSVKRIDESVRRILRAKFDAGLFEDPYRYFDADSLNKVRLSSEMRADVRDMGRRSIVLLQNRNNVLPLENIGSVALIGGLCRSKRDMLGQWAAAGSPDDVVTLEEALRDRGIEVNNADGYDLETNEPADLSAVRRAVRRSDAVVIAIGERGDHSGEDRSKGNIEIPDSQQDLVALAAAEGKPVVVLVMGGRPQIFTEAAHAADAVLVTWWLGVEAGNAIADVLMGDHNPSARLPMTFPADRGQIPIYYNHKSTGRPATGNAYDYTGGYIDISNAPAYPFGYGLSYTTFAYSNLSVSQDSYDRDGSAELSVTVTNTGRRTGEEVVQLYIEDCVASITRPVAELKGVAKIELAPNESRKVTFRVDDSMLGFYDACGEYVVENGRFELMVGGDSQRTIAVSINRNL